MWFRKRNKNFEALNLKDHQNVQNFTGVESVATAGVFFVLRNLLFSKTFLIIAGIASYALYDSGMTWNDVQNLKKLSYNIMEDNKRVNDEFYVGRVEFLVRCIQVSYVDSNKMLHCLKMAAFAGDSERNGYFLDNIIPATKIEEIQEGMGSDEYINPPETITP